MREASFLRPERAASTHSLVFCSPFKPIPIPFKPIQILIGFKSREARASLCGWSRLTEQAESTVLGKATHEVWMLPTEMPSQTGSRILPS